MKALLFALTLTACTDYPAPRDEAKPGRASVRHIERQTVTGVIYTIELTDGTPCVVLEGMRGGGIDCNWRTPEKAGNE
jgi:hypothetical protein